MYQALYPSILPVSCCGLGLGEENGGQEGGRERETGDVLFMCEGARVRVDANTCAYMCVSSQVFP